MELIKPDIRFEADYKDYINELGGEERYPYPMDLPHHDFAALVALLQNYSMGRDLPNGLVPNSTFWLVENQQIIAVSHLRHHLNDALAKAGGHIGVGVRPKYRGTGIGSEILKLTIAKARQMNISELHIHCHKHNIASVNMIKSVGAVLHSELQINQNGEDTTVQRYMHSARA